MTDEDFQRLEKIVYDNDFEAFKKEFENGMDLNFHNTYGWTPLHIVTEEIWLNIFWNKVQISIKSMV